MIQFAFSWNLQRNSTFVYFAAILPPGGMLYTVSYSLLLRTSTIFTLSVAYLEFANHPVDS
jgi:hypothetical protein